MSEQTKNFICRLENGAEDRYLGVSWVAQEVELAVLDKAVWELRRYCNSSLYIYSDNDFLEVKPDAYDVLKLIEHIKKVVKEKYKVDLELEIKVIGE